MSRKQADRIFSALLLLLIAWMVWEAGKWDLRARLFPLAIGVPAIGLALLQLVFVFWPSRASAAMAKPEPETAQPEVSPAGADAQPGRAATGVVVAEAIERAFGPGSAAEAGGAVPPSVARTRTLQMVGWILGITLAIVLLGFELGATLLTFLFLRLAAHERLRTSVAIAVATYLFFYIVFDRALYIPFPPGAVADLFGLKPLDHYLADPIADFIQNR